MPIFNIGNGVQDVQWLQLLLVLQRRFARKGLCAPHHGGLPMRLRALGSCLRRSEFPAKTDQIADAQGGYGKGLEHRGGGATGADDRWTPGQPRHAGQVHRGPGRRQGGGGPVSPGRPAEMNLKLNLPGNRPFLPFAQDGFPLGGLRQHRDISWGTLD